jgi:hypothetical protein
VQKIALLALGLPIVLVASFLAPGCGDGTQDSSGGKDSGLSAGGINGTGGSPGLGGSTGSASTGGRIGSGGMTGVGGTAGTDAATNAGGSGGADAGTPTLPACTDFNACGGSIVGTWKLPAKVLCGSAGSANTASIELLRQQQLGGSATKRNAHVLGQWHLGLIHDLQRHGDTHLSRELPQRRCHLRRSSS